MVHRYCKSRAQARPVFVVAFMSFVLSTYVRQRTERTNDVVAFAPLYFAGTVILRGGLREKFVGHVTARLSVQMIQ